MNKIFYCPEDVDGVPFTIIDLSGQKTIEQIQKEFPRVGKKTLHETPPINPMTHAYYISEDKIPIIVDSVIGQVDKIV